jgi:hypothetical protein
MERAGGGNLRGFLRGKRQFRGAAASYAGPYASLRMTTEKKESTEDNTQALKAEA